jgi:hypothetical protein
MFNPNIKFTDVLTKAHYPTLENHSGIPPASQWSVYTGFVCTIFLQMESIFFFGEKCLQSLHGCLPYVDRGWRSVKMSLNRSNKQSSMPGKQEEQQVCHQHFLHHSCYSVSMITRSLAEPQQSSAVQVPNYAAIGLLIHQTIYIYIYIYIVLT